MAMIVIKDRVFNNIQRFFDDFDISSKELALASSLSESTISDIKNGSHIPTQFTMFQITYGFWKLGYNFEMSDIFELDIKNVKFV